MTSEPADRASLFDANVELARTITDLQRMNDQQREQLDELQTHINEQESLNACLTRQLAATYQAMQTAIILLDGQSQQLKD